ncbi:carbon-nitrogen hydrolase family protein [Aeromicrobium sp. CTD01-1L150]|uniref:carbon-nitrogen hydrolase family protein n=1 Tax=Aeromicrobium sp. CTD01-1L150 TaxID=3341830 RepID=UPI0035C03FD7
MRAALAQINSHEDPQVNLEIVRDHVARAASQGAELVVFPEATMSRFGGVPLTTVAEPLDGPWAQAVREIAAEHGVTVVVGMFTPGDEGRVRNTLLVAGGASASYDKIHLFDAFGFAESDNVTPGGDIVTFEVAGTTVGLTVCYDVRFPALFSALADEGARVVVVPASWGSGPGKLEQWELLSRARALDSTCFVLACDQADPAASGEEVAGSAPRGVGGSIAVAPDGAVVDRLGAEPGLLVTDLDLGVVDEVRARIPVLANRRL